MKRVNVVCGRTGARWDAPEIELFWVRAIGIEDWSRLRRVAWGVAPTFRWVYLSPKFDVHFDVDDGIIEVVIDGESSATQTCRECLGPELASLMLGF